MNTAIKMNQSQPVIQFNWIICKTAVPDIQFQIMHPRPEFPVLFPQDSHLLIYLQTRNPLPAAGMIDFVFSEFNLKFKADSSDLTVFRISDFNEASVFPENVKSSAYLVQPPIKLH